MANFRFIRVIRVISQITLNVWVFRVISQIIVIRLLELFIRYGDPYAL